MPDLKIASLAAILSARFLSRGAARRISSAPPRRQRRCVDRLLEAEAEWCLRAETGELLDWWYGDGRGAHSHN